MYFFYIDESGSRDPETSGKKAGGAAFEKDPLYVLTAASLYEHKWRYFDRAIAAEKISLRNRLYRDLGLDLDLADCEVKSTWLRHEKLRKAHSRFLTEITDVERTHLAELYYEQLLTQHMNLFSVVVDKRKLHPHMDHEKMHKKAYELLLELIESFLREFHPRHNAVIVMDDTDKTINRSLSMKHAWWQRAGTSVLRLNHIVEYPFFADSRLSNGVQLADLCGYNVYRVFKNKDFSYRYFTRILPYFYNSKNTSPDKLDGLKVWPEDSDLVRFAQDGYVSYKKQEPSLLAGL